IVVDGLSFTSLHSLLVARRTLFLSLICGWWRSLSFWWVAPSPLNSLWWMWCCALAKAFALSVMIWLGVIGRSSNFLSLTLKVYALEKPSCMAFLSNCHGRPSNMWHTVIGTTSHSTVSS